MPSQILSTAMRRSPRTTIAMPRSRTRNILATTAVMLPALIAISALTWFYDLYYYRRRFSRTPCYHPSILLRPIPNPSSTSSDASTPPPDLNHPGNRIFNVRADRNILASGLVANCRFDAEIVESQSYMVCRLPRTRMRALLKFFVGTKNEVDRVIGIPSPLEYGTRGAPAKECQLEWVQRVVRGLRYSAAGGRRGSVLGAGATDDEASASAGWFEVWLVGVRNRCDGWVIEPEHREVGSLEDDDELPFTWANGLVPELRAFPGRWPKCGTTTFDAGGGGSIRKRAVGRPRRILGGTGMGGIRSPQLGAGEWTPVASPEIGAGSGENKWGSIDGVKNSGGGVPWGMPSMSEYSKFTDEARSRSNGVTRIEETREGFGKRDLERRGSNVNGYPGGNGFVV